MRLDDGPGEGYRRTMLNHRLLSLPSSPLFLAWAGMALAGCATSVDDSGAPAEACDPSVEDWPAAWAEMEDAVLEATNVARAAGADCGEYGQMPPVGPLETEPHLRCAARVHALDMGTRSYFSHDSPDGPLGDGAFERMTNAGYSGRAMGENIAAGTRTAQQTVDGWIDSDGHCANVMSDLFTVLGVGYAEVPENMYQTFWVQDFGG